MDNFFSGLHLPVGIADTCQSAIKVFEKNFLDGKDIGLAEQPELKRYHRNKSGTFRLIRTVSKAFAVGQYETIVFAFHGQHISGRKMKITELFV